MKRVALASLVLILVAVPMMLLLRRAEPPEMLIQGKPVISWALDLNNSSLPVREAAGEVLKSMGPGALPGLVSLLQSPDPVLARPVKWIGWHTPEKVRHALFRLIDPSAAVGKRAAAAQALRALTTNALPAVPALSRALHDDPTVAWHSALALSELGPAGMAALTQALTNTSPAQCGFVCYALSTQGQTASNAVPALASLLDKRNLELSEKAASALSAIGPPAVSSLVQGLSNPDPDLRVLVSRALASLGPLAREAVPKLMEIAQADVPPARQAAVDALAKIRPTAESVVAVLAKALSDPVRMVRLKAIEGLSRSPATSKQATPAIIQALKDESPEIRGGAASLLGEMGGTGHTVVALREALKDDNETVRQKARVALDKLNQRSS